MRPERVLLAAVATLALFVAVERVRTRLPRAAAPSAPARDSLAEFREGAEGRVTRSTLPPPPPRDYADIGQRIADGRGVTYVDAILAQRGGNVARWADRRENPITVWIQPRTTVRDFWPEFRDRARDAFYTWAAAGVPIRFLFIDDSAAAEVRVRWVDRFSDAAAGRTVWARDQNWWIVDADIELAVHRQGGPAYDAQMIRAIALHEVGHLIGLDHSPNPDDIMAARVHVMSLSPADLRTAALVYKLPPGPVAPPDGR
jgi:hypothetical protein